MLTSTPHSPDRLELFTASDVAVFSDQRQGFNQGRGADEAVAGITGIVRAKLVGQDGNFHGDGTDSRPGRDLPVLDTGDVTTLQAGALLDITLRKVFLLPDGA